MRGNFWQGLVYGSLVGIIFGIAMAPFLRPRKKTFLELGKDALSDTTSEFIGQAKRAQKKLIKRIG